MSEYELTSLKAVPGNYFRVQYKVAGVEVQDEIDPFEIRKRLDFWIDRQVTTHYAIEETEGGVHPPDPEPHRAEEVRRLEFLAGLFPTWPTDRATMVQFATDVGFDWSADFKANLARMEPERLWASLFGSAAPLTF